MTNPGSLHGRGADGRVGARVAEKVHRVRPGGQPPGLDEQWRRQNRYDRRARLVETEALTATGTVRLTFDTVDGTPLRFTPGQFIGITDGRAQARRRRSPYCLVSAPRDDGRFSLLVRWVPDAPMAQLLAALQPGEEIDFRGPLGRAMQPKHPDTDVVLLATGVGIGPLVPVAHQLLADAGQRTVTLYWGLRQREDICLLEELDELADRFDRSFSYAVTLSQPDPDWGGLRGRLTQSVPPVLSTIRDKSYLMVGNGAMIADLTAALSELGVPETQLHSEHYFNGSHRPDPQTVKRIRSRFVASDAQPAPLMLR